MHKNESATFPTKQRVCISSLTFSRYSTWYTNAGHRSEVKDDTGLLRRMRPSRTVGCASGTSHPRQWTCHTLRSKPKCNGKRIILRGGVVSSDTMCRAIPQGARRVHHLVGARHRRSVSVFHEHGHRLSSKQRNPPFTNCITYRSCPSDIPGAPRRALQQVVHHRRWAVEKGHPPPHNRLHVEVCADRREHTSHTALRHNSNNIHSIPSQEELQRKPASARHTQPNGSLRLT